MLDTIQTPSPSETSKPPSFSRKRKEDSTNQMFRLITHRLSAKEDEFDIFGKNVAVNLRTMTNTQKILAQKLINDVIFYGQIEQLSINSQVRVQPVSTNMSLLQGLNDSYNHTVNIRPSTSTSTTTTPQFQGQQQELNTQTDSLQFYVTNYSV